jgi:hypothetical protein
MEHSSTLSLRAAILRRDATSLTDPTAKRLVMALADAAESLAARVDDEESRSHDIEQSKGRTPFGGGGDRP